MTKTVCTHAAGAAARRWQVHVTLAPICTVVLRPLLLSFRMNAVGPRRCRSMMVVVDSDSIASSTSCVSVG